jgi:integrase
VLTAQQVGTWEMQIRARGYSPRTARDARATLTTLLGDAVPRYIQVNPAQRKRGKGRKGQRRIERTEHAEKVWATPLQALLVAERCAVLSGRDTDFIAIVTLAYTGTRWSELVGLAPAFVRGNVIRIDWKLYELQGRFYKGRPKDGSIRPADLPPFLAEMLARLNDRNEGQRCKCRHAERPWCPGAEYVFLGPGGSHFPRPGYGEHYFRPAADGWYPARKHRPAKPVLIDVSGLPHGMPLAPWPPATPGETFTPPSGRGVPRLISDDRTGRCASCRRALPRRLDGAVIAHKANQGRCPGSGQPPGDDIVLASWLPVSPRLTPHGLRHGHKTWMDEDQIADVLKSERLGHEEPGMRAVYGHVSPVMRAELTDALQRRWQQSLRERARLAPRSSVRLLDALLTQICLADSKIGSRLAPKIGHRERRRITNDHESTL